MVSQHELYVNVRFRRSSVFPTLLFLGTDQNGMTVNENTTADKISSTYRNSWNSSNFPRKFFLRRWFCRCMCINSPILSGVILHFINTCSMNIKVWNSFSYHFMKPTEVLRLSAIWKSFLKVSSSPKCHDSWHRYQILILTTSQNVSFFSFL